MSDQKNDAVVVGLYSFPKSGNTWLRAIIAGLTDMPSEPGVLQKYVTDSHYGKVIENPWNFQGRDWYFYKSHHKTVLTEHEDQTFVTDKILYIYRHPLDVFVSYLNFVSRNVSPKAGQSLPIHFDSVDDLTPDQMETLFAIFLENATLFPRNKAFGGVFEHIDSFKKLGATQDNVLVMRYEDLSDDFEKVVADICSFLDIEQPNTAAVYRYADHRTRQNGKFFWKRQKENFRTYLTDEQVARFTEKYAAEMQALGYHSS